jgi:hypothetical protein
VWQLSDWAIVESGTIIRDQTATTTTTSTDTTTNQHHRSKLEAPRKFIGSISRWPAGDSGGGASRSAHPRAEAVAPSPAGR